MKTLHPRVHGGILAKRGDASHQADLEQQNIAPIDVVVVNLYPFRATIARPDVTWDQAIENIDIGGPTMVRSSAKNHADVLVVVDPDDYVNVIAGLSDGIDLETRRAYAVKAFRHTAQYDATIAAYLGGAELLPASLSLSFNKVEELSLIHI